MNDKRYITELNSLIRLEPVHPHLSFAFLKQGKPRKALDTGLSELIAGNQLISVSFPGVTTKYAESQATRLSFWLSAALKLIAENWLLCYRKPVISARLLTGMNRKYWNMPFD